MQCSCYISTVYGEYLSDYIENIIEVFMDDFSVNGDSFDKCLKNLTLGEVPFYGTARYCIGPCDF